LDVTRFLEKVIVTLRLEPPKGRGLDVAGHIENLYAWTQYDDLLCEHMAIHLGHDDVRQQEKDFVPMMLTELQCLRAIFGF
jgi:hypothetical protein